VRVDLRIAQALGVGIPSSPRIRRTPSLDRCQNGITRWFDARKAMPCDIFE